MGKIDYVGKDNMFPLSHHAPTKFKRDKIHECKKGKNFKPFGKKYGGYCYDSELGKNQIRHKKSKSQIKK